MYGIYNCIPETNHVPAVYSVTTVLYLQFTLHIMLFPMLNVMYFYISTSHSMCPVQNIDFFLYVVFVALSLYVARIFSD